MRLWITINVYSLMFKGYICCCLLHIISCVGGFMECIVFMCWQYVVLFSVNE